MRASVLLRSALTGITLGPVVSQSELFPSYPKIPITKMFLGGSMGALFTPLSTQLTLYCGTAICMYVFHSASVSEFFNSNVSRAGSHSAYVMLVMCGTDRTSLSCPKRCFMRTERAITKDSSLMTTSNWIPKNLRFR